MARTNTNTQNDTKTRKTPWRNIHLEKNMCMFFKGQGRIKFVWLYANVILKREAIQI